MSTSFKRIQSDAVQYGESFVLSGETEEETVSTLTSQKQKLQSEIEAKKKELDELKNSMKELLAQKDTIIENANKSAEEIKSNAVLEANDIVAKANADKDNIVNEAKTSGQKQGFEAGYNEGLEKLKADYAKQINALNVLAGASFEVKNEIVYSSETEILELALLIAEKVVRVKFDNDINAVKSMTQTAISMLKEKENLKLVVNPKIIEYVKNLVPELEQDIDGAGQIKIVQDKAVSPDGIVVESVSSRIDARISTQMETLARTLLIDKREHNVLTDEIDEKIISKTDKIKNND